MTSKDLPSLLYLFSLPPRAREARPVRLALPPISCFLLAGFPKWEFEFPLSSVAVTGHRSGLPAVSGQTAFSRGPSANSIEQVRAYFGHNKTPAVSLDDWTNSRKKRGFAYV